MNQDCQTSKGGTAMSSSTWTKFEIEFEVKSEYGSRDIADETKYTVKQNGNIVPEDTTTKIPNFALEKNIKIVQWNPT